MISRMVIFTNARSPLKGMEALVRSPKWEVETEKTANLRKELKSPGEQTIYMIDYASVPEPDRSKELKYILKKEECLRAVIDRKNEINDPAELLMQGCDYIGANTLKEGVKPARVNKYENWFLTLHPPGTETGLKLQTSGCEELKRISTDYIVSKNGWKDIKSGKKYTFYMMFTEFSIPSDWIKKSGSVHLNQLKQIFQSVAERTAAPLDGKLWIWNEYGGLILFPYTGTSCTPVISAVKMLLNRALISIEDFRLHAPIHLKVSIHLGTTTWKARGNTGTIISDSINSIFHLGTKYTPADNLDITEEVFSQMIPRLQALFNEAGVFEERRIYRLKQFKLNE